VICALGAALKKSTETVLFKWFSMKVLHVRDGGLQVLSATLLQTKANCTSLRANGVALLQIGAKDTKQSSA
jgi:hypothetical protein